MHEPNYAVNLELAELVNNKKANTYVLSRSRVAADEAYRPCYPHQLLYNSPRDAAMETVRKVNDRNPHTALLGLHVSRPE